MKHQIRDYESSWFQLLILSPFSPCSTFPCSGLMPHSCMLNHFLQALFSVIYGRFLPGRRRTPDRLQLRLSTQVFSVLPAWSSQVLRCWAQPASESPGRKQAPSVYFLYKYTEARSKKGQGSETAQLGSVVSVPAFLPMPLKEHIYLFLREPVGFVSI